MMATDGTPVVPVVGRDARRPSEARVEEDGLLDAI